MKSLNVKRIAAVAAGAAMLGAAFATAVTVDTEGVGNFKFFNNGEPGVKVVVGSTAMASDAVAAANIAAMLGNLAYTTAQVDAPSSSGSVQLEVTAPSSGGAGVAAGEYGFNALLDDNVDNSADNLREAASTTSGLLTGTKTSAKKISKDQTSLLELPNNGKLAMDSLSITEEQNVYVNAQVRYLDTEGAKQVIAKQLMPAYEVTFSDSLPYCLDTAKTNVTCTSDNDLLEKNSKLIYLFGEPWTVSDMTTNSSGQISAITLGKSSADLNNVKLVAGGELIASNGVHVKVTDVTAPGYTTDNLARVGFDFISADGASTVSKGVNEGSTLEKLGVTVKVESVVGNTAYVSIYADKLELTDQSDIPDHGDWRVILTSQANDQSPGLSKMLFYTQSYPETSRGDNDFRAGESAEIITGSPSMKVTFKGLNLGDEDYDSLSFERLTGWSRTIYRTAVATSGTAMTGTVDVIRVKSDRSNAFQFTTPVTSNVNEFYYVAGANSSSDDVGLVGQIVYESAGNWYNSTAMSGAAYAASLVNGTIVNTTVPYYYSGDSNEGAPVNIFFHTNGVTQNAQQGLSYVQINVQEVLNESLAGTAYSGYWNATYDLSNHEFRNTQGSSDSDKLTQYVSTTESVGDKSNLEAGFVSSRGSKLATSPSSSGFTIEYAKKLGRAVFALSKSTSTVTTASGASVVTADSTGEVEIGGGYKVKVGQSSGAKVEQTQVVALNPSSSPLVVLDSQASETQPLIVVGGPFVNTVAQGMTASADLKQNGDAVVKVEGTKMLVAGWSAADTTDAANALISWLSSNRDAVRGGQ